MKLSICFVTMNRACQLAEALESCLSCELPVETEFVVIDNASTDNTESIVKELIGRTKYRLVYQRMDKNIGAGAGRNKYYELASGEYIYGMDDDAVIDSSRTTDFFHEAIRIFETCPRIVALGTQVFDEMWNANRLSIRGRMVTEGVYRCKAFCGGSHFLRRSFYGAPPYFPNIYGYEELPPSIVAFDLGMITAFVPNLVSIHKPKVNRWNYGNKENLDGLIRECATQYAIKRMMYPWAFYPFVHLAFRCRCAKHLHAFEGAAKKAVILANGIIQEYPIKKRVKVSTVVLLVKEFGLSIF